MDKANQLLFKAPEDFRFVDVEQGSDEWRAWRMSAIGASVGLRAMNFSRALFDHYTGVKIQPDFDNQYMRHGREHEAAARFQHECNIGIDLTPMCAQRGFISASSDGVNLDAGRGCEIKCLNLLNHEKHVDGDIDAEKYHQCQQTMYVFGFDSLDLVLYFVDPGDEFDPMLHVHTIKRDDAYIAKMVERLTEFWKRVQAKEWPDEEKTTLELAGNIAKPEAPAIVVGKGVPDELSRRASSLIQGAGSLKVTDQRSAENATDIVKSLRGLFRKLEDARKGVIEPHREYITQVNNLFKSVTEQITNAGDSLKGRLGSYQQEQERLRREEQRKAEAEAQKAAEAEQERLRVEREAAEEAARNAPDAVAARKAQEAAAEAARQAEEAQAKADEEKRQRELAARQPAPTRGMAATASTRKTWEFEVTDINKVPRKYMVLDEKAVRAAISGKDGKRKIAGLKISQKETTVVR